MPSYIFYPFIVTSSAAKQVITYIIAAIRSHPLISFSPDINKTTRTTTTNAAYHVKQ